MHTEEVEILSDGAVLAGTLTAPDSTGEYPAVLMVHGSGPLDRNENIKGQELNIFNTLAFALADHGIASLRYDKRGCGDSTGDYLSAGHADLVLDAERCLDTLARSALVTNDSLFILGHSEGCIIAPQISHNRPSVAGLILLCPFMEPLEPVLLRQAAQLEQELDLLSGMAGFFYRVLFRFVGRPRATQQRLIRKVRETDSPVVRVGLSPHPAKWLREMLALDPEAVFAATKISLLLVGGEKDLQCNPDDIFRIAETAQGHAQTCLVEGMTHLLRVDENPASLVGSSKLSSEPMEDAVIDKTIQWIHATLSAGNQFRAASTTES